MHTLRNLRVLQHVTTFCVRRAKDQQQNVVPKEPMIFLKPTSAYIVEGEKIRIPLGSSELHHEVELGVIIGRGTGVGVDGVPNDRRAYDYIGGYCLALDMTDRAVVDVARKEGLPWTFGKGFDTALPVSRFIKKEYDTETEEYILLTTNFIINN